METEIIPFQISPGMGDRGSWVGEEEEDLYVWIRRFDSEAERERLYEAVYQSDTWLNDIGPGFPSTSNASSPSSRAWSRRRSRS